MHRSEIIEALEKKGYQAKKHDVIKNSHMFKGITINTGTRINPVIYTGLVLDGTETADEAADKVISIYETYKDAPIDANILSDREWIMDHLTIAFQRVSDEDLVKKPTEYEGIEQYLIIIYENPYESFSIKVTPGLLANARLPEFEAWGSGLIHLIDSSEIISLKQMLSDTLNQTFSDNGNDPMHIHVVTTSHRTKGAAAILNRGDLMEFAKNHDVDKLVVLPSSIHEMLVIPYDGSQDIDDFSRMVKEINATQVAPEERLTDKAYIIEF